MATKVHMEALSPTMEEGQLVRWLKNEGDAVKEGDVLAEIETDKATMELVARGSGVLSGVSLKEGETAAVGTVIATIGEGGGAAAPKGEGGAAKDDSAKSDAATTDPATGLAASAPGADAAAGGAGASREPETGGSEASGRPEEQEDLTPAAEGTGAPADAQGAEPKEARAAAGATSPKQGAGDAPSGRSAAAGATPAGKAGAAAPKQGSADGGRLKASPLARRLAEEAGVDLAGITGTGPGGRITKRDIEAAGTAGADAGADAGAAAEAEVAGADAGGGEAAAAAPAPDTASESVPVTQMRKAIAKRLATSIGPIPTFYLTIECDMTQLMELRERTNRVLEKEGGKASVNDFLVKAVAAALSRHPEVNASWGENVIRRHHDVHIGVAVAVEDGLITPIVRNADRKRVRDIAAEVKELAGRAREKKLKPEEYTGATFSISNLGMFGIVEFTAIINPPEAGIIAVGAVEEKVVVEDGEMVVRPRMRITMSCDHRVIDGATGAKFLQTVREYVEDPMMMLA